MATKKVASKKSGKAAQPAKKAPAQPAKKATGKAAAPKKAVKSAPAKTKPAAKKAPAKPVKAAAKPAAKAQPAAKAVAKPAAKTATKAKVAAPKKEAPQKATPQKKVVAKVAAAPVKPVATKAPAKAEPVKKPEVAAPTKETTKEATKPLENKPAAAPKEPARPAKVVIPKTSTDKAIKYEPDFTRSILDNSQKQEENGPTMRYSDAELAEFRELINKKLDIAKKELAYLQGLITRKDESGDLDEGRYMTMEDGSMSMEREQLSQMASRQIQFIDHLEKAIMRIENKTYGICRVTGKLIDKARLRAVPHATLSIEAKQMMNK
jgi:RNA polymerase-binding transcription factor DksA